MSYDVCALNILHLPNIFILLWCPSSLNICFILFLLRLLLGHVYFWKSTAITEVSEAPRCPASRLFTLRIWGCDVVSRCVTLRRVASRCQSEDFFSVCGFTLTYFDILWPLMFSFMFFFSLFLDFELFRTFGQERTRMPLTSFWSEQWSNSVEQSGFLMHTAFASFDREWFAKPDPSHSESAHSSAVDLVLFGYLVRMIPAATNLDTLEQFSAAFETSILRGRNSPHLCKKVWKRSL